MNNENYIDEYNNYIDDYVGSMGNMKSRLNDLISDYSTEEIIEAMGIEKVQNYLRKKKIENIKK